MKKVYRILALLLCTVLILSFIPSQAVANESYLQEGEGPSDEVLWEEMWEQYWAEHPDERAALDTANAEDRGTARSTDTSLSAMRARAEALVNYQWTPSSNITTWYSSTYNGKTYFPAGTTVTGVPYTLFTTEVVSWSLCSLEQYKSVASINYSASAYCLSKNNEWRTGPVYGSCCADLVCEVFGGSFMYGSSPRYHNVNDIWKSPYGTTLHNQKMSDIRPGDAVSNVDHSHIIWVSDVTDTTITIYEQTPPIACKHTLNKSSNTDSSGNFIYKGSLYNAITRSKEYGGSLSATTNSKVYSAGEAATFSFEASGASSVHLYLYYNGVKLFEGQFAPNETYQYPLQSTGHYAYYIVGHYASGDIESAWNDFQVVAAPSATADATNYTVGSTATITLNAPGASSVHLYIYYGGDLLFEGQYAPDVTYQRVLSGAGHYAFYMVAHYDMGDLRTEWGEFQAVEMPVVNADKAQYALNEAATFSFTAPLATSLHLYIYKGGEKYFEGQYSPAATYQTVLFEPGTYEYYIVGHYPMGDVESAHKEFHVLCTHSYTDTVIPPTCTALGYTIHICSICGDSYVDSDVAALGHNFVNGVCTRCGASAANIESAHPVLNKDINMVYAVSVPDGAMNPYMVFTYQGEDFTVYDFTVNESGQYCFTFSQITPQCMGDNISAVLHVELNGADVTDTVENYSVAQYCSHMLANESISSELRTLISDLLAYGAAAQTYMGYNTNTPVTGGELSNPTYSTFTSLSGIGAGFDGDADADTFWTSAGLTLTDSVAMNFRFYAERVNGLTVYVTINGRTQTFTDFNSIGNGVYEVSFTGISAEEFGDTVTAVFERDDEQVGNKLSYSVNAYICSTQNSSNANLRALVRALYNYGASAAAYANAQ